VRHQLAGRGLGPRSGLLALARPAIESS